MSNSAPKIKTVSTVEKHCLACGNTFLSTSNSSKFCSKPCRAKGARRHCDTCNTLYHATKKQWGVRFCSLACAKVYLKEIKLETIKETTLIKPDTRKLLNMFVANPYSSIEYQRIYNRGLTGALYRLMNDDIVELSTKTRYIRYILTEHGWLFICHLNNNILEASAIRGTHE